MRLIDADALMKELEREVELADDWKTAHEISNVVKYFPTIEPEKHTEKRTETHARDCISRRKAFEYFVTLWECIGTIMDRDEWEDVCMTTANEIPSAQPERKTGRWVSVGCVVPNIANVPMIKCTVCGHLEPDVEAARTPYCSHCGAYMGGDTDETD